MMMKKLLLLVLFSLYQLGLELVYLFGFPLVWLILRFKHYSEAIAKPQGDAEILIHAASLGEINALASLIHSLKDSGYRIAINTITVTGRDRARSLFPELHCSLAPLDIPHLKIRQMRQLKPKLILIAETEIWPNILYAAQRFQIPLLFINARISARTLDSYRMLLPLLQDLGSSVRGVLAQSELDRKRFEQIFPGRVKKAGNLKFAIDLPSYDVLALRKQWGYEKSDLVLCWGSSRPGEELLLLSIYAELKQQFPQLRIILAPRHPKRLKEIEQKLMGYDYILHSQMQAGKAHEIVLIDSLGRLAQCYAMCDLAIIGGSFYDFGGHNPLEPAFYGKAVLIGNYHAACRDSVAILQQSKAIIISSEKELAEDLSMLLNDRLLRTNMGAAARLVLTENASALDNHIKEIETCLN